MRKIMMLTGCLLLGIGNAQAAGLLDWLSAGRTTTVKQAKHADAAQLLTLEPDENEMYPQVSPDGKHLLLVAIDGRGKRAWISNRATENGDPLNVVTDDARAPGSVHWHGADAASFLSLRAGSLGLWTRAADGKGLVRRVAELGPGLTQSMLLPDGGLLAMHVMPGRTNNVRHADASDGCDNWSFGGARTEIVRIDANGSEHVLTAGANPALSPDGQWIAFSMPTGRSMHLFLMRVDGSALMQLTDERSIDVQPAWSPDGKWIVFASNRADADMRHPSRGNWDIWAIDRQGRDLVRLTYDAGRDGAPSVAADGTVYFHTDRAIDRERAKARQVKGQTRGVHIRRGGRSAPGVGMH